MAHFLIVEARFYDHLNDMLVAGAEAALKAAGHSCEVATVPGAVSASEGEEPRRRVVVSPAD